MVKKIREKIKEVTKGFIKETKGSKNRNKARLKVAKLHEKIANQRKFYTRFQLN